MFGFASEEKQETTAPAWADRAEPTPASAPSGLPPAAQRREQVLQFVVSKLRAYQNEPEIAPAGLRLDILCGNPEEEALYQVVLWKSQPGRFREELTRQLADNYITLPENWRLEYGFHTDQLPDCNYRQGNLGLSVFDKSKPDISPLMAKITALVGQTAQIEYTLDPTNRTTFCIGRGYTTQTASGRVRTNEIVILNDGDPGFDPVKGAGNGAVSRAHATIRYDMAQKRYTLLVDPGGLPVGGNKTKIVHPDDTSERADIAGMGYPLNAGDQIELGGEVVLLFELQ